MIMQIVVVHFKDPSRLPIIGELIDDSDDQINICHIGYLDSLHKNQVVWSTDPFWAYINRLGFPILKKDIKKYYNPSKELTDYFMSHCKDLETCQEIKIA